MFLLQMEHSSKGLLIIDDFHNQAEGRVKKSATSAAASSSRMNINKAPKHVKCLQYHDLNTSFCATSPPLFLW